MQLERGKLLWKFMCSWHFWHICLKYIRHYICVYCSVQVLFKTFFSCGRYLGGEPQMCAKLCVGLHVQRSFLLYSLTKTGMCWQFRYQVWWIFFQCFVNVNYGQINRWSKVNRCMFIFCNSERARKEVNCMAIHLHGVTTWRI